MNKKIKTRIKPSDRFDKLVKNMIEEDDYEKDKQVTVKLRIRGFPPSGIQLKVKETHPRENRAERYITVDNGDGSYLIHRRDRPSRTGHTLRPNPFQVCDRTVCQVVCKECPNDGQCAHLWICTCQTCLYTNICIHIHVLKIALNEAANNPKGDGVVQINPPSSDAQKSNQVDQIFYLPIPTEKELEAVEPHLPKAQSQGPNLQQVVEQPTVSDLPQVVEQPAAPEHPQVVEEHGQNQVLPSSSQEVENLAQEGQQVQDEEILDKERLTQQLNFEKLRLEELFVEARRGCDRMTASKENIQKIREMKVHLEQVIDLQKSSEKKPERHQKHKPIRQVMFPKSKPKVKPPKPSNPNATPTDFHIVAAIDLLMHSRLENERWPYFLNRFPNVIQDCINGRPAEHQAIYQRIVDNANNHWRCQTCQKTCTESSEEVIDIGLIKCRFCNNVHHKACLPNQVS